MSIIDIEHQKNVILKNMYYSDKYSEIPSGIVNKVVCGCGLSSFALENKDKLILVVPNISMIQNKVAQYPNERRDESIFGLYGDISIKEFKIYLKDVLIPKVIVTYDSFYKLVPYIDETYHIVVDEFSELLDAYGYRNKAINSLLNQVFAFPKLSFISATPIKKEYLPPQLRELPYTKLTWEDEVPVQVMPFETTKPLSAVLNIIKKYKLGLIELNGHKSDTAYFYVNSVKMIRQIIDKAGLLPSEVRIICANTPENEKKLDIFDIQSTLDEEKQFNFLTSSNFKGSDIYSKSGIAYVVSNNQRLQTLLTIDTDIYQIAGRIRNIDNPFRNFVYHIFNQNPLSINQDSFDKLIENKIFATNEMLKIFENTESNQKDIFLDNIKTNCEENYLYLTENRQLIFDEIKLLQEKRIYDSVIKVYQSGLTILNTYKENNFEVLEETLDDIKSKFLMFNNFKAICKMVCENKCDKQKVFEEYPLIKEGYEKLGCKKLKALGYDSFKIKNELNNLSNVDEVISKIKQLFEVGKFYSSKDIKVILSTLYRNMGINKKAKSTDIEEIFNVKMTLKLINNKTVRGYQL